MKASPNYFDIDFYSFSIHTVDVSTMISDSFKQSLLIKYNSMFQAHIHNYKYFNEFYARSAVKYSFLKYKRFTRKAIFDADDGTFVIKGSFIVISFDLLHSEFLPM